MHLVVPDPDNQPVMPRSKARLATDRSSRVEVALSCRLNVATVGGSVQYRIVLTLHQGGSLCTTCVSAPVTRNVDFSLFSCRLWLRLAAERKYRPAARRAYGMPDPAQAPAARVLWRHDNNLVH